MKKLIKPTLSWVAGVALSLGIAQGAGAQNVQFVGNITTNGSVRNDFMDYWDQITPENEGKWGSVERSRDNYSWRDRKSVV